VEFQILLFESVASNKDHIPDSGDFKIFQAPNLPLHQHDVPYWNRHHLGGYPGIPEFHNTDRHGILRFQIQNARSKTPWKTSQSVVINRVPAKSGNMWVYLKISQNPVVLII
jgi:hypothetical protein